VFTKQSVNPFLTTGLLNWLVRRRVEELVIFGVSTNQVVEATARHADDIGLSVVVLEDCCAAGDAQMHEFAATKTLPIFARVTSSEAFLRS
jgi:biuret amidohydrolase